MSLQVQKNNKTSRVQRKLCLESYIRHPAISCLRVWQWLRKKCPYSELFWSVFSRIQTEYAEIRSISPYSVWMRENTDQKNSKYGHFLRSEWLRYCWILKKLFIKKSFVDDLVATYDEILDTTETISFSPI